MLTSMKAYEVGILVKSTGHAVPASSARRGLEAWKSEGGSLPESSGGFDPIHAAIASSANWRASNYAERSAHHSDADTPNNDGGQAFGLTEEDSRILRCLGAAVVMRWNTLPTKLQRDLFDIASSVGDLVQAGLLKGEIARFLHAHKDDAG